MASTAFTKGDFMKKIAFTIGAVALLGLSACSKTETTNETTVINETSTSNDTLATDNASMSDSSNATVNASNG